MLPDGFETKRETTGRVAWASDLLLAIGGVFRPESLQQSLNCLPG